MNRIANFLESVTAPSVKLMEMSPLTKGLTLIALTTTGVAAGFVGAKAGLPSGTSIALGTAVGGLFSFLFFWKSNIAQHPSVIDVNSPHALHR